MRLYLWHIEWVEGHGYDEYSDAVVVARTEADARLIHPDGSGKPPEKWIEPGGWGEWRVKPEQLKVVKVGTAAPHLKAGEVVVASYHAG